jgi:hypothetical protein
MLGTPANDDSAPHRDGESDRDIITLGVNVDTAGINVLEFLPIGCGVYHTDSQVVRREPMDGRRNRDGTLVFERFIVTHDSLLSVDR